MLRVWPLGSLDRLSVVLIFIAALHAGEAHNNYYTTDMSNSRFLALNSPTLGSIRDRAATVFVVLCLTCLRCSPNPSTELSSTPRYLLLISILISSSPITNRGFSYLLMVISTTAVVLFFDTERPFHVIQSVVNHNVLLCRFF